MSEDIAYVAMVDDDPIDAFAVRKALARTKRRVKFDHFDSGDSFLTFLDSLQAPGREPGDCPDIVLLDVNMPRMDGYELLQQLRSHNDTAALPVIMLTTSEASEHVTRSYACGANSHIVKPSTVADMNRMADTLIDYWIDLVRRPDSITLKDPN